MGGGGCEGRVAEFFSDEIVEYFAFIRCIVARRIAGIRKTEYPAKGVKTFNKYER